MATAIFSRSRRNQLLLGLRPQSGSEIFDSPWWLLAAVGLGLAVRLWVIDSRLQLDEYGPAYAVAEHLNAAPGVTPSAANALVPVSGWQEVQARSVFPYGIVNPHPVYHYLLYLLIQILPIAEWSLRLPSLIAGLGCVAAVYFLCRQLAGAEVALVAALVIAVEPRLVTAATQARPYAMGQLGCILSILSLRSLLHTRRSWTAVFCALGYGLSMGFIGYMNPVLLWVVVVHAAQAGYVFVTQVLASRQQSWSLVAFKSACAMAGCMVAALLLWPQRDYLQEVRQFYHQHRDYLRCYGVPALDPIVTLNRHLLEELGVVLVALLALRILRAWRPEAVGEGSSKPRSSRELVWLGGSWLVLPQLLAIGQYFVTDQAAFTDRYLVYSTLGGVILLAYLVVRERSPRARVGLAALLVLATFIGEFRLEKVHGAYQITRGRDWGPPVLVQQLNQVEAQGSWKEGDLVLFRAEFMEGDFLPDQIPPKNLEHIERLITGSLNTLYAPETPRPFFVLSMSQYRSDAECTREFHNTYRRQCGRFYDAELANKLKKYQRFWFSSHRWDRPEYLAGFLPWLADALGSDLQVSIPAQEATCRLTISTGSQDSHLWQALYDQLLGQATEFILIERK